MTQEIKKAATERPRATNTRLQLRLPDGSRRVQVFEADDSLKAVYDFVSGIYGEGPFELVSAGPPPIKFKIDDDIGMMVFLFLDKKVDFLTVITFDLNSNLSSLHT